MIRTMSLTTRRELLDSVRQRYENANRIDKGRVLDGFVAACVFRLKWRITVETVRNISATALLMIDIIKN